MWRLVFEMARKLDIQVFATTHSWDCISAFQRAAQTSEAEGILVRLQHTREETVATEFDEDELEVATRRQIEVR
jgi:predicted ATP-dependent endonuclease of OLD family